MTLPVSGDHVLQEINIYGASRIGMAEVSETGEIERYDYEIRDHQVNLRVVLTFVTDGGGTII